MTKSQKALYASVYKHNNKVSGASVDTTNGGVTGKSDKVLYLTEKGIFDVETIQGVPVVEIIRRPQFGDMIAVPVDRPENTAGPMFGGNFIYSTDARFPSKTPIAVHDRFETWAEYDRYSR